jgi:hypothetical protein
MLRCDTCETFVVSRRPVAVLTSMSPTARSHLHPVGSSPLTGPCGCRTAGCPFKRQGQFGFCQACERVYQAAQELRERLLARRSAQLRAARPELFDAMAPELRDRLLAHVAAQGAHRGQHPSVLELAGLEDFLAELRELSLAREEPT